MIQQIVGLCFWLFAWTFAPAQEIIFVDSFDTNEHEWTLVEGRKLTVSMVEGGLGIRAKSAFEPKFVSQVVPIPSGEDYEITLRFVQTKGAKNMGIGLCWGAKRDYLDWQAFLISTNGKYTILHKERGHYRHIKRWTESRNVCKQKIANELRVQKKGERTYYYLNDKLAYVSATIPLAGPEIGILVHGTVEIIVEELIISALSED